MLGTADVVDGRQVPLQAIRHAVKEGVLVDRAAGTTLGTGADFYAGNCHKWLCAPKGAGFLYARREVQHLLEPLVVSWGWNRDQTSRDQTSEVLQTWEVSSRLIGEQEWQGTRDPATYLSVPAAIQFQAEHNWPRVRQECHEPVRHARQAITDMTGLEPICPDSAEWYA